MTDSVDRYHGRRVSVRIVVGLAIAVVSATLFFRHHVIWRVKELISRAPAVERLPVRAMVIDPISENWKWVDVGDVRVQMPKEFSESDLQSTSRSSIRSFSDGELEVSFISELESDAAPLLALAKASSPKHEHETLPQIKAECYRAASGDFRWLSSNQDLRWHEFCITTRRLVGLGNIAYVQTRFDDDVDIVVLVMENRVIVEWQSRDMKRIGQIHCRGGSVEGQRKVIVAIASSIQMQ